MIVIRQYEISDSRFNNNIHQMFRRGMNRLGPRSFWKIYWSLKSIWIPFHSFLVYSAFVSYHRPFPTIYNICTFIALNSIPSLCSWGFGKMIFNEYCDESIEGDLSSIYSHYFVKSFGNGSFWIAINSVENKEDEVVGMIALDPHMEKYVSETTLNNAVEKEELERDSLLPKRKKRPQTFAVLESELRRLSVDERFRGKGLASKLFDKLLEFALEKGMKEIFLTVTDVQYEALEFYRKKGFKQVGEKFIYWGCCRIITLKKDLTKYKI